MCMIAHLVAVITFFHSLGSSRCQSSDIYMESKRIFEIGEEIVELKEKLLLLTFEKDELQCVW